jgi:hypothetical protein
MTTRWLDPGEATITGQKILRCVDGANQQFAAVGIAGHGRYAETR